MASLLPRSPHQPGSPASNRQARPSEGTSRAPAPVRPAPGKSHGKTPWGSSCPELTVQSIQELSLDLGRIWQLADLSLSTPKATCQQGQVRAGVLASAGQLRGPLAQHGAAIAVFYGPLLPLLTHFPPCSSRPNAPRRRMCCPGGRGVPGQGLCFAPAFAICSSPGQMGAGGAPSFRAPWCTILGPQQCTRLGAAGGRPRVPQHRPRLHVFAR